MGRIILAGIMMVLTIMPVLGEERTIPGELVRAWADRDNELWVEWSTDEIEPSYRIIPTDAQVEYGPTEALGFTSEIDPELTHMHRMAVSMELKHGDVVYYRVRSKDTEGNIYLSPIEHIVVDFDFVSPKMSVKGLVSGQVLKGLMPIEVEASDDVGVKYVSIEIKMIGDRRLIDKMPPDLVGEEGEKLFYNPPYRYDWDTTRCPDTKYLIRISVSDKHNLVYQDIKVTVDNIPNDTLPIVRIISPVDGQVIIATESHEDTVKIIVDATDDMEIRRVDCLVNERNYPLSDWPPYEGEWWAHIPGDYTLQAKAKDRDGNVGLSETILVKVVAPGTDITPPVTTDNYQFNNTWTNQDANVTLTTTDDITGVKETHYTIDGTEYTGTNISITQEGIHTVQYWSIDNSGNSESPHTIGVWIDKTPPVTIATMAQSPNQAGWNNTLPIDVTFTATDNLSGIKSTTPNTLISEEGVHEIGYQSIDNAGNTEEKKTVTVNVDTTAPEVTISAEPSILWPVNKKQVQVTINGTSTDALSGISTKVFTVIDEYNEVKTNLSDFGQVIELIAWRIGDDKDGRIYTIQVIVRDKADNSTTKETTVTVPHDMGK